MYLMDMVTHTAVKLGILDYQRGWSAPEMTGYMDLYNRLRGTPRYLFDSAATRTVVELNLGRPKVMREAMAHLRVPYRSLWVEWDDSDRQKLRERFSEPLSFAELRPMPGRLGFLIESDETGRRGRVTWAWDTPPENSAIEGGGSAEIPNIGAVECLYDLDRVHPLPPERQLGLMKGNLAKLWIGNPVQLEALWDIWRTCEHRPARWAPYFFNAAPDPSLQEALSYADVVGEYIMVWGALLLLTASRPIVDLVPVDLKKLNKVRAKKGRTPLLDHTRVTLHLTPQAQRPVIRGPLGYSRKSPRVHMVSSYLARRGTQHWVVQPYWRGSGEVTHRVVNVRG